MSIIWKTVKDRAILRKFFYSLGAIYPGYNAYEEFLISRYWRRS